jgi:L-fuculose-phosphate aldolase
MNYKEELISIAKFAEQKGFVNAYEGNISLIDRLTNKIYITPSGTRKLTLTEDQIAVVDQNGNQIEGSRKRSSEIKMHKAAYDLRPDCNGVVHAHCPYLTAYAMCGMSIVANCHEEFLVTRDIPCIPHGKAGTEKIFDGLKGVIKDHDLILLGNHGALCVGKTLDRAFMIMEAMENTVKSYTIACQIGKPKMIPDWDELYAKASENIHTNN